MEKLRHNLFVTNIFEGWINGHNKGRRKPRTTYLEKVTRQTVIDT